MRRANGARGSVKPNTPMKQRAVWDNSYQPANAGVYRHKVHADAVMKAGDKPENSITNVPWGGDPFAGDVTALRQEVILRPTKQQLDLGTRIKRNPTNIQAGITGVGQVQPDKTGIRFKAKNQSTVGVSASSTADIKAPQTVPILPKNSQKDNLALQPGVRSEYLERVDPDSTYNPTNSRSRQEYVSSYAEALPNHQDFTPVYPEEFQPSKKVTVEPEDYDAGYIYNVNAKSEYDHQRSKGQHGKDTTPLYAHANHETSFVHHDSNFGQNKRSQNNADSYYANAQYEDDGHSFDNNSHIQHRRHQAQNSGINSIPEHQVEDDYYYEPQKPKYSQPELKGMKAQKQGQQTVNDYYGDGQGKQQNKRHQNNVNGLQAQKYDDKEVNDHQYQAEKQKRKGQSNISGRQANKYDDKEVNDHQYQAEKQKRKEQTNISGHQANKHDDYYVNDNGQYNSEKQSKKTQTNMSNRHANKYDDKEVHDNQYPVEKQSRKEQVEVSNRHANRHEHQNVNDNESEVSQQHRRYNASVSNLKSEQNNQQFVYDNDHNHHIPQTRKEQSKVENIRAEVDNSQVTKSIPQEREIKKSTRKYQAGVSASKPINRIDNMVSNVSEVQEVKQEKKHQATPEETKAHAQVEQDVRSEAPNMKFTQKKETLTNRPIINTKIITGDSNVRIQAALEKARKQQSSHPVSEKANPELIEIRRLDPEDNKQNVTRSAKPEQTSANYNTVNVEPKIEKVESQRRQYSAQPISSSTTPNFNDGKNEQDRNLVTQHVQHSAKPIESTANERLYDNNKIEEHDATSITEAKGTKYKHDVVDQAQINVESNSNEIKRDGLERDRNDLSQIETKKHLARSDAIGTQSALEIKQDNRGNIVADISQTQNRREPIIQQEAKSGANKTIKIDNEAKFASILSIKSPPQERKLPAQTAFKRLGDF